ncbi:MAG: hypothetical protein QGG48_13290 [Desulfatiglandales bacterium]|nr:hypothetical protein [Desulfatiglandales bacterium]
MKFECIIYEKEEGIATIKLNWPEVLNAMNKRLWLDFQIALDDMRDDTPPSTSSSSPVKGGHSQQGRT